MGRGGIFLRTNSLKTTYKKGKKIPSDLPKLGERRKSAYGKMKLLTEND